MKKKYRSFLTESLEVEYQLPKLEENNKYKIHFHKLYKVYLCMIISFFFNTKGFNAKQDIAFFYSGLDTFFFVFTQDKVREVLFSNTLAFSFH